MISNGLKFNVVHLRRFLLKGRLKYLTKINREQFQN